MKRLIECVPNFSEGRDMAVIDAIKASIQAIEGVTLLDVDPGAATHRTVFTFVGEPEPVIEAAVAAGLRTRTTAQTLPANRSNNRIVGNQLANEFVMSHLA